MMRSPCIIGITDASQVAQARRRATELAENQGWDEAATGRLAIAVTEAATNQFKHAEGGEIHLQPCERAGQEGLEILALDRGPGMADVGECLRDGYSTGGTTGTGLGAIRRLADEFDLYSQPGRGTALVARLYASHPQPRQPGSVVVGAVRSSAPGESVCGDNWGMRQRGHRTLVMVADGLGHGMGAAEASQEAVAILNRTGNSAPASLLEEVHLALRHTRGAAVAVADIDTASEKLRFAGVGNISAMIHSGDRPQHLVSTNGTAGHTVRKIQEFEYRWPARGLLIMHSDGLTTSWRLDGYPGLTARHPSTVAAVLYRDAIRGKDDACAVAAHVGE